MQIQKFTKLKNGQYKIKLEDGRDLILYEDLIFRYELLLHKKITPEDYERMQKENQSLDTYYVAIQYLKRKARSEKELKDYLRKKEYPQAAIDRAIERLTAEGYLNDANYAKLFVHEQQLLTSNGPAKIRFELEKRGISTVMIEEALREYPKELQNEKMAKIIAKMIRSNHNKSNGILKRKMMDYLSQQGFDRSDISDALEKIHWKSDQSLKEKEYEKIKAKLQTKYSGKELEYKIKQKMYQKGFYNEE